MIITRERTRRRRRSTRVNVFKRFSRQDDYAFPFDKLLESAVVNREQQKPGAREREREKLESLH